MKQIAGLFLALFIFGLSHPFAQEAIPPKDPTGAVEQKDSPEWLLNQGREQLDSKRYDQAIQSFTKALAQKPEMILAYHGLTMAYLRLGDVPKAQETAQKAVAVNPNDANSHLAAAQVALAQRQPLVAIESFKKVTQLVPHFAVGHYDLGTAYLQVGKPDEAAAALKEAVRLNPNWVNSRMNLAVAYLQLKKDDEGIAELKEALRVAPGAFFAAERLARESVRLGRYAEAVQAYAFLSRAPLEPQGCRSVTFATYYAGRGGEAAVTAQECLQMHGWRDRSDPYVALFQYLGWRQAKEEKQASAALNELQKQLSQRPSHEQWPLPVVRYLRHELSAEELLKAAGNTDEQTEARAYLGCELSLQGKKDEALPHLRWVKENGNRNFVEYTLAVLELHRLTNTNERK